MTDQSGTSDGKKSGKRKARGRAPNKLTEAPHPIIKIVAGVPVSLPGLRCMEDRERG